MGRPKKKKTKLYIDGEKLKDLYMNPPYLPKETNVEVSLDSLKTNVRSKALLRFIQEQRELTSKFGSRDNVIMMAQLQSMGYMDSLGGAIYVERNEFDCNLTSSQIEVLTDLFNSHILMYQTIGEQDMRNLFYNPYQYEKSLQVKSNRLLIYLFVHLHKRNFIASDWQNIIDKYNLFSSPNGKHISRKDISRAKASFMGGDIHLNPYPKGYEYVDDVMKKISHK